MNKVKKIMVLLSIIMLIGSIFVSETYAALNCSVNLSNPKNVTYKEQFSVYVSISNLQTTKGIIAIGAVLSYDKDSLELVDIEGENKWSAPSYNTSNGKMTSFKNKLSKSNENVFKITFEVKEKGKAGNSAWIKISDFEISDGDEEKNCGGNSINIAIKESSGGNSENDNQDGNNKGDSNQDNNSGTNQGGSSNNSQGGSSSGSSNQETTETKKPSTGNNNTKKPSSSSTTKKDKEINKVEDSNDNSNNAETNTIENVIEEDFTNDNNVVEDNNIQNDLEENNIKPEETKEDNKGNFYIVSVITIIAIIGILLLIKKFWKTN